MFTDRFVAAPDGTRLHYRDYPGDPARPAVICLHGLTRNARDFEGVAPSLQSQGHRVLVPDMRGRGQSAHADPKTYALPVYLTDMDALFADAGLTRAVHIGTSMGGLLTLLTAAARPGRVAAAVLNDIGPVIEPAGLHRIGDYIGQSPPLPDWNAAATAIARTDAPTFPDYTPVDWLLHAHRRARAEADGHIRFDYDPALARTFSTDRGNTAEIFWPMLDTLAATPLLSVRGELSDLFSAATQAEMVVRHPAMHIALIPRVGHAPSLDEPQATKAIDRLLATVA